jgi:hypothetical protein
MRRRYNNTEQEQEAITQEQDFLGDIGNFELPDIDLDLMEFLPSDETEETRYTLPKVVPMREDFVLYDNAQKMARELRLGFGERFDAFVSGSFIFGDFIEAYLTTQNACAKRMTISTLSMSQNNVDSLHTLMEKGYIEELNLIISVYFWGNERSSLIPYIYKQLDIGPIPAGGGRSPHQDRELRDIRWAQDCPPRLRQPPLQRKHRAVHHGGEPRAL